MAGADAGAAFALRRRLVGRGGGGGVGRRVGALLPPRPPPCSRRFSAAAAAVPPLPTRKLPPLPRLVFPVCRGCFGLLLWCVFWLPLVYGCVSAADSAAERPRSSLPRSAAARLRVRIRGGLRRGTPPFLAPAVGREPSCCCGWGGSHRVDDNKRNHRGRGVCSLIASSAWPLRVLLGAPPLSAVGGFAAPRLCRRRRGPALLAALRASAAAPLLPRLAAPARRRRRRAPVRWPFGVGRLGGCSATAPQPPTRPTTCLAVVPPRARPRAIVGRSRPRSMRPWQGSALPRCSILPCPRQPPAWGIEPQPCAGPKKIVPAGTLAAVGRALPSASRPPRAFLLAYGICGLAATDCLVPSPPAPSRWAGVRPRTCHAA